MPFDLIGKTSLVTGAAKRVGREIALELAAAGANVVVHYRSSESDANELAREIKSMGRDAWTVQGDFAVVDDISHLVVNATQLAGPINILVNNASAFPKTTIENLTWDSLAESVKSDAWAPFALARDFVSKPGAEHIINILDTRVTSSYDWTHVGYLAAKHMLYLFTRMMAIKFAPDVAVNGVAPGLILPPEGKGMDYIENLKGELPLKRIGNPRQVAEAVLFLARSEFITGQVIYVDGGRHLNEG